MKHPNHISITGESDLPNNSSIILEQNINNTIDSSDLKNLNFKWPLFTIISSIVIFIIGFIYFNEAVTSVSRYIKVNGVEISDTDAAIKHTERTLSIIQAQLNAIKQ